MQLKRGDEGRVTILEGMGNVKVGESAQQFASELQRILDQTDNAVLIDVSGIDFVDSTGIGELVGYMQRFADANRKLALLKPHRRLESLLKLLHLEGYFVIFQERDAALKALSAS